jgi:hypothetical protein
MLDFGVVIGGGALIAAKNDADDDWIFDVRRKDEVDAKKTKKKQEQRLRVFPEQRNNKQRNPTRNGEPCSTRECFGVEETRGGKKKESSGY